MSLKNKCVFHRKFKEYLVANFPFPSERNNQCRMGHILFVFITTKEVFSTNVKQVDEYYGINIDENDIKTTVRKAKKWSHNFLRNSQHFVAFNNKL